MEIFVVLVVLVLVIYLINVPYSKESNQKHSKKEGNLSQRSFNVSRNKENDNRSNFLNKISGEISLKQDFQELLRSLQKKPSLNIEDQIRSLFLEVLKERIYKSSALDSKLLGKEIFNQIAQQVFEEFQLELFKWEGSTDISKKWLEGILRRELDRVCRILDEK